MARGFVSSSSQSINCTNITAMNGASKLTIGGWFKRDSGEQLPIGKRTDANNQTFINVNGSGLWTLSIRNGTNALKQFNNTTLEWIHVIMVFDGTQSTVTNRLEMYVNGAPQAFSNENNTHPTTTASISNPYRLGELEAVVFGGGSLAEQKVWTTALTVNEVYMAYQGQTPQESSLVEYQPLGYGSPEPDYSGNLNNGTLVNAPAIADHPPISKQFGTDSFFNQAATVAPSGPPVGTMNLLGVGV